MYPRKEMERAIDILSVDGAFAAVTHEIWPPSWSGDGELESSMN